MCVASLGLVGLAGSLYLIFGGDPQTAHAIHGFWYGCLDRGIVLPGGAPARKSADVGADLGKSQAGIPEDDPAQPRRDCRQCRR
ncbi:MAG: sodium/proton-translocating pyrophosphatase [Gammaproteobacteria bacterium]|nr:sodium/proton-translocating pyrophosphatase [Gammaproteobacteria bacterium]